MSTRYVLHDSIGSGGMATVHIGHLHAPLGFTRVVAIKRLHPALSHQPEFAAMLVDEARITARVRHLNVIPTLDVFLENGECFLVMEYVEGESLAKLLRSASQANAAVPLGVVSAVLCGVLHGLHAAHVATSGSGEPLGIIHRDVSPQNIIVGSDGIARVFDFGVAKALGRLQQTRAGEFKGKLPYLAPEQFGEGKLDRRVDVYAASVTLWEALTTRRLFDGGSEEEVFGKILQSRIAAPSELRPDVPASLDEVVLRGLARAPAERFASAAEMALALERAAPPASAREVAVWLESLAGEALAKRASLVTEIDGGTKPAPITAEASPVAAVDPATDDALAPTLAAAASPAVAAATSTAHAAAASPPPQTPLPTPIPAEFPSPTVTQRMTVPLRAKPRRASATDEAAARTAVDSAAAAWRYAGGSPAGVELGNATPPPHSLPVVVEPNKPRRMAIRASVIAAALLCTVAAPAFGWMALANRDEPAHAAALPPPKIEAPKVEPARPIKIAATPPSPQTSSRPPDVVAETNTKPKATVNGSAGASPRLGAGVPASAAPKASVGGLVSAAPKSAPAPAVASTASSAAARAPVKAKPAPKTDYLSSAPYSQRR